MAKAKGPPDMTPAEFNVMKVLWRLGNASVSEVRSELLENYGSDLAYTTVMTLLGRLASKGALRVDRSKQPYVYRPAFRRDSVIRYRLKRFVETVFDGRADSLVLHLLEQEDLSADDLRRIEQKLRDTALASGADREEEP
jgi:predicted transcriptional regulator